MSATCVYPSGKKYRANYGCSCNRNKGISEACEICGSVDEKAPGYYNDSMECKYKKLGCGGCEDISLPYPKQLENKNALAKRLLGEFGEVLPVIGMDSPQNYRCKVISTFARDNAKKLTLVKDGKVNFELVAPDDALKPAKYAAKEAAPEPRPGPTGIPFVFA